jgi:hypothetical protein
MGATAHAGSLLFDNKTDTVSIPTQTVLGSAYTIEAVFAITGNGGFIFNEHTFGAEDKQLGVASTLLWGFSFPNNPNTLLEANTAVSTNTWHHSACVLDNGTERLFFDGVLVASRNGTGAAGNGSDLPFLGAIFRNGAIQDSFIGHLDSFQIQTGAAYNSNFVAPTGDMTVAATALIYYNFNEGSGNTITNVPTGVTATLGTGFSGATSPVFVTADPFAAPTGVPEPSSIALAAAGLAALAFRRFRK